MMGPSPKHLFHVVAAQEARKSISFRIHSNICEISTGLRFEQGYDQAIQQKGHQKHFM